MAPGRAYSLDLWLNGFRAGSQVRSERGREPLKAEYIMAGEV